MKRYLAIVFILAVLAAVLLPSAVSAQVPTLQRPVNGATDVPLPPTLYWNELTGADIYQVQVSTASSFTHTALDVQTADTSRVASTLDYSTLYYWRVRAGVDVGGIQWGNWSAVWSFTTDECDPPSQPTLQTPSQSATGVSVPVNFNWSDASNATSYRIQVDNGSSFISPVENQTTTGSSAVISGLSEGTQYWWRVKAYNDCDSSNWSSVWNFTTEAECNQPNTPTLLVPSNGAAAVHVPVSFDWSDASYATSYRIQIDNASSFASPVSEFTTTASATVTGLAYSTQFWWRVKAYSDCDSSGWTSARVFTTESAPTFADSIIIPTVVVTPNQQNVRIPIRIVNVVDLGGLNVPLSVRQESGNASITSISLKWEERCSLWETNDYSVRNVCFYYDSPCLYGDCWVYENEPPFSLGEWPWDVASVPVGICWNSPMMQVLPAGSDTQGSLVLEVDIGPNQGLIEIDTTCLSESLHEVFFIDNEYPFTNRPITFIAGLIEVVSCCGFYTEPAGYTGNANCSDDGKLTLSDITRLIDRVYISKEPLCCEENGNTNGSTDGKLTLSDITALIDNVYISKELTAPCL